MTAHPLPSYWAYNENRDRITRRFETPDFKGALVIVEKIAETAEELGHHPEIRFGWGFVEVTTWTHDANAVTEKDFSLARAINEKIPV